MEPEQSGRSVDPIMPAAAAGCKWGVVAIVGVGLIGGSVGAALRSRGLARQVIGVGRDCEELEWSRQRGWIDSWTRSLADGVRQAELAVVCVPVDQIAACIQEAARHLPPQALITDAGSTKRNVLMELQGRLPQQPEYVPAHPLAGSDKSGPRYADPNLFERRQVILTPWSGNTAAGVSRIRSFWRALGAEVVEMSSDDHDRMAAAVSHLPHVLAAALVRATPAVWLPFAASGFRDTTRIAGGDPRLWSAILLANRDQVLAALDECERQLSELRRYLEVGDRHGLQQWLAQAQQVRHALGSGNPPE